MPEVVNIYYEETIDGLYEIKVLDNGLEIKSLIKPSQAYLDANQPNTEEAQLSDIEKLRLEQAQSNIELIELIMSMLGGTA